MRAIIDTCVLIDFLQKREPFYKDAYQIMRLAATDKFAGYTTAKAISDIYYLTNRCTHDKKESRGIIEKLCTIIGILDTEAEDVFCAMSSNVADFEDAMMIETGRRSQVDCIITRNTKDYEESSVTVYSPDEFLNMINKADA